MISDLIGKKFVDKFGTKTLLGAIGDADPITNGGGVIFKYDPETLYGDAAELCYTLGVVYDPEREGDADYLKVYSIDLSDDLCDRFDYVLSDKEFYSFSGTTKEEMTSMLQSIDWTQRALAIETIASYIGWSNVDEEADLFTEEDLEEYWFTQKDEQDEQQ